MRTAFNTFLITFSSYVMKSSSAKLQQAPGGVMTYSKK